MSKLDVFQFEDFVDFLKAEYGQRVRENPRYTQTQYSKLLGVRQSSLSELLNRRHGISLIRAKKLAKRLQMNAEETQFFCDLAEMKYSRAEYNRALAKQKVKNQRYADFKDLSEADFSELAGFYSFVIIEALKLGSNGASKVQLPGMTEAETAALLTKLEQKQLIEQKNGTWNATVRRYRTQDDVPSECGKEFHRSLMSHAARAISEQDLDQREYQAFIMAMPKEKVGLVKNKIKNFVTDVAAEYASADNCDSVYAFGLQFFEATPTVH